MRNKLLVLLVASCVLVLVLPALASAAEPAAVGDAALAPWSPPSLTITTQKYYDPGTGVLIDVIENNAFKNLTNVRHTETTKWFAPDSTLYQSDSVSFTPTKGAYNDSHQLLWAGTWAEQMPGTWTIKVYLDGSGTPLGTKTVVLP